MSREAILAAIRAVPLPKTDLPDSGDTGGVYADSVEQFKTVLRAVGGEWVEIGGIDQTEGFLQSRFPDVKRRYCNYSGASVISPGTEMSVDPHDLEDLDLVVVRGTLGVAENAAVWVNDDQVPHRVAYFCTQHLVLILDTNHIVHNLHEAYARVGLQDKAWGLFISGPSKTADIEQCLVIGAHGPRSLTVALL